MSIRLPSLCSIESGHPFIPTCLLAERRFRPGALLVLHLHQVAQGTFTPKLSDMSDTQDALHRLRRCPPHSRRHPLRPLRAAETARHWTRRRDRAVAPRRRGGLPHATWWFFRAALQRAPAIFATGPVASFNDPGIVRRSGERPLQREAGHAASSISTNADCRDKAAPSR